MAIAHICLNCGFDLARTRAVLDTEYGFSVVRCPHCATAVVRRQNVLTKTWHYMLRLDMALSIVVLQLIVAFTLLVLTRLLLVGILDVSYRIAQSIPLGDQLAMIIVGTLLLAICTGAWLTAGFSHIKRIKIWFGWLVIVLVSLLIVSPWLYFSQTELFRWYISSSTLADTIKHNLQSLGIVVGVLSTFMILATLGIWPGKFLLVVHKHFRQWRWRRRRRRARCQRATI